MLKKVKDWLGIEGVKLALILPEKIKEEIGEVEGVIRLFSKNEQKVSSIKVRMVERYSRGRKNEKLTDEYQLGEIQFKKAITIPAEKPLDIAFTLPYSLSKSEMDELEDSSLLIGGLIKIAKKFQGVKSEYYIQAEAKVAGTGLNPFDKQLIELE